MCVKATRERALIQLFNFEAEAGNCFFFFDNSESALLILIAFWLYASSKYKSISKQIKQKKKKEIFCGIPTGEIGSLYFVKVTALNVLCHLVFFATFFLADFYDHFLLAQIFCENDKCPHNLLIDFSITRRVDAA